MSPASAAMQTGQFLNQGGRMPRIAAIPRTLQPASSINRPPLKEKGGGRLIAATPFPLFLQTGRRVVAG